MTDDKKRVFVDTNVLLRANNDWLPLHKEAAALVEEMWLSNAELWISRQIIREYLVQVTRPQANLPTLPVEQVMAQIETIHVLYKIADETAEVTRTLLDLIKTYPTGGKQIHDANIVATMLVYGIDTLLTQNIADMKRFAGKITILPLEQATS